MVATSAAMKALTTVLNEVVLTVVHLAGGSVVVWVVLKECEPVVHLAGGSVVVSVVLKECE